VIDISGDPDGLAPEISGPTSVEIEGIGLFARPDGATRLTFLLLPGEAASADLRVTMRNDSGSPLVWLHRWTRARDGGV
jgi:glucans biosynthesis protein